MGRKSGPRPQVRDLKKETDTFLKEVEGNQEISDLTKQEIFQSARESLAKAKKAQLAALGITNDQAGLDPVEQAKKLDPFSQGKFIRGGSFLNEFDASSSSLRKEFEAAKLGEDSKFRFRQFEQARTDALRDRPGRKQLITSR